MKGFLRTLSAVMLLICLGTFTLWRNERLPDLSGVNTMLKGAMGQVDEITSLIEGMTPTDTTEGEEDLTPSTPYQGVDPVSGVDAGLAATLAAAFESHRETVDLSSFSLTVEELQDAVSLYLFSHPEYFHVSTGYAYSRDSVSQLVTNVSFQYIYTAEELPTKRKIYDETVAQIAAGVPTTASDFDKILYLHDYFVQNYAYDYEGLRQEQATGETTAIRDAYAFFTQKTGVCQAYMLALIATADAVGLECIPVTSDGMNHAWNMVELDGEWYHIDVTWDDAGGEESAVYPSYISYDYFLLSGEALYRSGRTQPWEATEEAVSKTYDTAIWHDALTPMAKANDHYYCILYDKQLGGTTLFGGTPTEMSALRTFESVKWYAPSGKGYYPYAWASIVAVEEGLLFNTGNMFYLYNVETSVLRPLADMTLVLGGKQIFGISQMAQDGTLTYVAANDYSGSYTELTWLYTPTT